MYQLMLALLQLGESDIFGKHGVKHFQLSKDVSGELKISSCVSSPHSVQVSGRMCHRLMQISSPSCSLLGGVFLVSYSSQHLGRCYLSISHHLRSCQG